MGDPLTRKSAAISRLRENLKKKRESLADQFDFKMYIIFHFKDKKKKTAVFEAAEVVPVMTNNYEDSIMKGVKEEAYSYESSKELLERDVVQFHATQWQSLRNDVFGCTSNIDFFLWPRKDIDRIECMVFSRWKGDSAAYRPVTELYAFDQDDYVKQLMRLIIKPGKSGLIINNPTQSMFLFIDKEHLQTTEKNVIVFKLSSICLYLPQDQLTHWGPGTIEDLVSVYLNP